MFRTVYVLCTSILLTASFASWSGDTLRPASTRTINDVEYHVVTSAEELAWVQAQVNSGNDSINVFLDNDIIFGEDSSSVGTTIWNPIGDSTTFEYNGKFNGDGHTIYGLKSKARNTDGAFGLFGWVGPKGNIAGVDLKNFVVTSSYSAAPYSYGGAIAAALNKGSVQACNASGEIDGTGAAFVGGIVGLNHNGIVAYSMNQVKIKRSASSGMNGFFYGGIVGKNLGEVSDCINIASIDAGITKSIEAKGSAGGIIGYHVGGSVSKCINAGKVLVDAYNEQSDLNSTVYVGGIIGYSVGGTISNCANYGHVIGKARKEWKIERQNFSATGGIIGLSAKTQLKSCVNYGDIDAIGSKPDDRIFAGGLIGLHSRDNEVSDSYSAGNVKGDSLQGYLVASTNGPGKYENLYFEAKADSIAGIALIDTALNVINIKGFKRDEMETAAFADTLNKGKAIWSQCDGSGLPVLTSLYSMMCEADFASIASENDSTENDTATTVAPTPARAFTPSISVSQREILIESTRPLARFALFDIRGKVIASGAVGNRQAIKVAHPGKYIVSVDNVKKLVTIK